MNMQELLDDNKQEILEAFRYFYAWYFINTFPLNELLLWQNFKIYQQNS